ncbi:MAG: UDP-N-acetylmuramyl-tripeptide synthetase, partial [Oscillospiraceae bacterium]
YVSEKKYDVNCDYLLVSDIRKAMAYIAAMHYDYAFKKFKLTAITGTKGKTTTAFYIKYILDEYLQDNALMPSGVLSSVSIYDGVINGQAHLTTPEAVELHQSFDNAYKSDLKYMTMEVSSQALKYDRVLGVTFDVGVFLNIDIDHISNNEHSDFEDYFSSKLKMFSMCDVAFVNLETDYKQRVLKEASVCKNVITFGFDNDADYQCISKEKVEDEIKFTVKMEGETQEFAITMPGLFNVENALAAIAVTRFYGIPLEYIKKGLYKAKAYGRMEVYKSNGITAIVDYAHNALSFSRLFQSVKEEYPKAKIISVFGCPGSKAVNRREELGTIAAKYSDMIFLTEDDPGYENTIDICNQIVKYLGNCPYKIVEDRLEATKKAVSYAKSGDVILLLGKGNEGCHKVKDHLVFCKTDAQAVCEAFSQILSDEKISI